MQAWRRRLLPLLVCGVALVGSVVAGLGGSLDTTQAQGSERLVVFGPSQWDTFVPGAPAEVVDQVTQQIDDGFRQEHPEVGEIVHDARGTVADGLSRLTTAQLAGDQVDLIMCAANPLNTSYQQNGMVAPVDDLVPLVEDRLVDGALTPFTIAGQTWGIPLSGVSATTFFYNKTLFDEYGLTAPTTYDEFLAAAQTLTENGVIPVIHQGKNPWMWPIYYMSALAQTTDNQQLEKTRANLAGEAKFTDAPDVEALELTRRWVDDGILDPSSLDLDEEGMRAAFLSGQAASYFGGSWDLPFLAATVKDFELGVFKFPQFEGEPGASVAYGGVEVGLCLSATSENLDLAKAYIEYATRPAIARLALEPLNPIATSHKAVVGSDDPIATQIRNEHLPTSMFLDWVWPRELTDTIQREIQSMMAGARTPQEAAEAIQAKYDQMVADGYTYAS